MQLSDDILLEPLDGYNKYFEKAFEENAEAYFDELVKKSGINVEQNRSTVKLYREAVAKVQESDSAINRLKTLRGLMVVLTVVCIFVAVAGIFVLAKGGGVLTGVLMLTLGVAVGVTVVIITLKVINKKIRDHAAERAKRQKKADEILAQCEAQMAPLNALFESNATKQLIEQTVPKLVIDDNFEMRRYDYMQGKYGFGDNDDPDCSTLTVLSGEILGNPFVIDRELVRADGQKTYHGELVISWTTTYTDSEGNTHTQSHTQTLHASVTRFFPLYSERTRLIYGNEAAPDLSFSRRAIHTERLSAKGVEKRVKDGVKQIRKMQERDLKSGDGSFTEMGNAEFDVLFGALDRDQETQFRLLFTPLAQKNMLALLKDSKHFGDDFNMYKRKCLNYVSSEHSASWDLDTSYERYMSYDVDISHKTFVSFNCEYFKNLYFEFAPLLSIPLYQQHKPHEYIYKDVYARNYTNYEAEIAVNRMRPDVLAQKGTGTPLILKTRFLGKDGQTDNVEVTAKSYRIVPQVEYISVHGGDGNWHSVPVPWDEYVPIERVSTVALKNIGLTDRQFNNRMSLKCDELGDIIRSTGGGSFGRRMLCCTTDKKSAGFDARISRLIK